MTKVTQCRCLSHQASISSDEHHAIIQSDDTNSIQPDDSIEFLSSQVIYELPKRPSKSTVHKRRYEKPKVEVERKKISRCVALIAFLLLGVCFALMGISFALTSTIDEMELPDSLFEETCTTNTTKSSPPSNRIDAAEVRRKVIARIVGAVAIFFIVFSCVLLGISFNMSEDINDKVRNSNTVLRKHNMAGNSHVHVTNESYFH